MKNKVLDKVEWLQTNKETTFIHALAPHYNENENFIFSSAFVFLLSNLSILKWNKENKLQVEHEVIMGDFHAIDNMISDDNQS